MTVSATQEARLAATAASTALPPASSTSMPASTVAGWPAATAACTRRTVPGECATIEGGEVGRCRRGTAGDGSPSI